MTGVREISVNAADSENDTIFWEVAERGTASPEKATAWVRVLPQLWTLRAILISDNSVR